MDCPVCTEYCRYGRELGRNGCLSCCPVCTDYCRYGRELGSNGCLSCQSVSRVVVVVSGCPVCTEYCRYGRELGPNGCLRCCPVCTDYCRYGRELGSNGCLSCQCRKEASHFKEAPIYGRPLIHPSPYQQRSQCPPLLCKNYCNFGRVKTDDGCDTCKCNSEYFCEPNHMASDFSLFTASPENLEKYDTNVVKLMVIYVGQEFVILRTQ
ncbi:antistasin-like [Littorina saxatilis]|uniref:antistasin-like n=1 Tax=Littorina saxatilis TaxID=31220 RepID=UPI0038B4D5EC